jgi:hypothetical protein
MATDSNGDVLECWSRQMINQPTSEAMAVLLSLER